MANTVDKVLAIAAEEVGYLEKSAAAYRKDPTCLDEKTRGAGSDNYTKYGRDMHKIYPAVMDFPAYWCDAFVDWCFYKAYGVANAKALLGGNFDDYTVASCQLYKNKNALDETPTVGSQVFFTRNGQVSGCHHTGVVYQVDAAYFYTVEGNTSGASGVVSNGGGVARKKYGIAAYKGKVLFGHPKYDKAESKKTVDEVAKEILNGVGGWGNDPERTARLKAAGYDAVAVQDRVNELSKSTTVKYYKKYTGKSESIVEALSAVGVNSSKANRKKIAAANGISGYTGSAVQNMKLLALLKKGKLVKA